MRGIGLFGVMFTAASLAADWLRTPGIGPKGSALAVIGLLIAAVPLFRSRKFENWHLKPAQFLPPLLIVAALMNGYLMIKNPNIGGDALWFHSSFHNLVAGKGYLNPYPATEVEPGYGMLSYPFYLLFGSIELSGMLVSAIAYLLIILTTYITVDFLFSWRSATLAAWLVAFWPALLSYSYVNLSDVTFALFALLTFSVYTRILLIGSTFRRSALLGLTLGISYLVREIEGLWIACLVLLSLFALVVVNLRQRSKNDAFLGCARKEFLHLGLSASIFTTATLFYALLLYSQTGVWTISTRIKPIIKRTSITQSVTITPIISTFQPTATEVQNTLVTTPDAPGVAATAPPVMSTAKPPDQEPSARTQEQISLWIKIPGLDFGLFRQNCAVLRTRALWMNLHALAPLAFLWLLYPFVATKRLFDRWVPDRRALRMLMALGIFASPLLLLLVAIDRTALRYYLSDFIYLLILAAILTVRLLTRMLESVGKERFLDLGIALICLATLAVSLNFGQPSLPEALAARHAHLGLRASGLWLRENAPRPEDIAILSPRKGQVALFYASGEQFLVQYRDIQPTQTLDEISALVNTADFDYLVLDNHYVHQQPHMKALWNNPGSAQEYGLLMLHRDPEGWFQIYVGEN